MMSIERDDHRDDTDILIVTVLPEEYAAMLGLVSNARPAQGRADAPNLYGWCVGTITRERGGVYRVALALAGRAGNVNASQVVVRSVEWWKPRYVLLVGIAGGLSPGGCAVGDVVVSTEIYGYEYGKVDVGFQPRPDGVHQVDRGLCNSAQAFAAANPNWFTGTPPSPKVLFGPVASGDKVVDDPSEPFFAAVLRQWPKLQAVEMEGAGAAAAIGELHAVGAQVGFLMVRGISDIPRPRSERTDETAQTVERDANKRRACEVAARFVVRWISAGWPVEPRGPVDHRGGRAAEPPGPTEPTARTTWLDAIIRHVQNRRVLTSVSNGPDVHVAAVWVPVRLTLDRDGKQPAPSLSQQLAGARSGARIVVLGEAGAGKTELLFQSAEHLAELARTNLTSPVPILVRARDLQGGFEKAVHDLWPMAGDIGRYVANVEPGLIVLVDGLDEAGADAVGHIDALTQKLGDRCKALIVSSRPVLRYRDMRAEERWISRWSSDEADGFLNQYAKHFPSAVRALRSIRSVALTELLGNPLTATFCIMVAERQPDTLRSRAALFEAVVVRLVDEWICGRKMRDVRPSDLMPGLEMLALEVVQQPGASLSESDLRRAFPPYQSSTAIEGAEVHLGLLVRGSDGHFDFAFRGLAEHLAGRSLATKQDSDIVNMAQAPWGAEVARHAIGIAARHTRERSSTLIEALLPRSIEEDLMLPNRELRALIVAIRSAADLELLSPTALDALLQAAFDALLDEMSVWTGERVADAVAEWVRIRPKQIRPLIQAAIDAIVEPASRAAWYASQTSKVSDEWLPLLFQRDLEVRWVATQKLAPFLKQTKVRDWLFGAFYDEGFGPGVQPVAIGAGRTLRRVPRDLRFRRRLPELLHLLEKGHQFQRIGAALALLPGEADPERLAVVLGRALASGFNVQRDALEAIAGSDAGREALNRACPEWQQKSEPRRTAFDEPPGAGQEPSCSQPVRDRLLRAIAPALRGAPEALLTKLREVSPVHTSSIACELAEDFPAVVCALLKAAPETSLATYWDPELEKLSRAAARHPAVGDALIDLWNRIESSSSDLSAQWKCDYPGRALDGLIRRGNTEAEIIFAKWLGCTNHAIPTRTFGEPLLRNFECRPLIRDAGHAVAQRFLDQITAGSGNNDGEQVDFVTHTGAEALFRLSSFWRHDLDFRRSVEQWLASGKRGRFQGALWALQEVGLTEQARSRLPESFAAIFHGADDDPFFWSGLWSALSLIDRLGLSQDLRELIEDLVHQNCIAAIAIAITLPWHNGAERTSRSMRIARQPRLLARMPKYLAVRLVEAAPKAWAKVLENAMAGYSDVGSLLPFMRALSPSLQARVANAWVQVAAELPWVEDGLGAYVRPADSVRKVLFDLGLERVEPMEGTGVKNAP